MCLWLGQVASNLGYSVEAMPSDWTEMVCAGLVGMVCPAALHTLLGIGQAADNELPTDCIATFCRHR